jgi:large repetitive protein
VRKLLGLLSLIVLTAGPIAAQTQQPVRVKCGGPALTDSKGQSWAADFGFDGGSVSLMQGAVAGTSDPALYQAGRLAPDSGVLHYNFPVSNGTYHVNLYFAELAPSNYTVGGRVFNVLLENNHLLSNFDIFAAVGAGTATIKGSDVTVTNGVVNLEFDTVPGHDRAKIMAIEIVPGSGSAPAPQMALNFVYPDGAPVSGTLNYTVTTPQTKISGNTPLTNGQATAVLYAAPQILGLAGQVQLSLSLTDAAGHVLWQVGMTFDSSNANINGVQSSALSVVVQKAS